MVGAGSNQLYADRFLSYTSELVLFVDGSDSWRRIVCNGAIYAAFLEIAMAQLDNIIHQPARLRIMSSLVALDTGEQVDFVHLRKILNLTNGNLGAHLAKLENAGYIKIDKTFIARKPRTFISATGKGRDAFENHIAALEAIVHGKKKPDH